MKSRIKNVAFIIAALLTGTVAKGNQQPCFFPKGSKTSVHELVESIIRSQAVCGLPWRALKSAVQDPSARQQLDAAYDAVLTSNPALSGRVMARKADVSAAAGHPEAMLALADANVRSHPEDKSLANFSCFVRGRYGFDVVNAMAYCNAAVADGRHGWALVNRGRVNLETESNRAAAEDFNEALGQNDFRTHPMFVDALYGRGVARLRLGDNGGAADIEIAVRARPNVVEDFEDGGINRPKLAQ